MKFLRKHLQQALKDSLGSGMEVGLEKPAHDRVLREKERKRGAFAESCFYILDNPRRAGLVTEPRA